MHLLFLLLLVLAAVCFGLTALGVSGRINLLALGLLAWVLCPLIQLAQTF